MQMVEQGVGARLLRKEDDRLMGGRGEFVADIRLRRCPTMLTPRSFKSSAVGDNPSADGPMAKRSWPLGKISCRRLDAGLEHVERIEAARFAVGWKKVRVSAAMVRSDDHEIVRQVESLDAEVRMLCAELSSHAGFEVFGRVRITKDRLAFSEKPAALDQRARVGRCACERREVGNDDVAFLHHGDVLFINRLPDLQLRSGCLGIFIERWQAAQT